MWFYLNYIWWIPKTLFWENNTKELVFFVGDPSIATILIILRKLLRIKYKIYTDWHMFFKTWKYRLMATNSDYMVTTSKRLKENIIKEFGASPDKIKVVYGGVDLGKFEEINIPQSMLRKKLGLPIDNILISYVGLFKTMGMEKGIDTMIKSLPFIINPKIKMVFVGGKEDQIEEYKKLASELGVIDKSIFVGMVPNDEVPKYEKAMDVLVIPYPDKHHFREYGFPMKVYEYMASNRPIIYSKLDIIDEMLSDCGYSFKPDDPENLAKVINGIIDDPTGTLETAGRASNKVHAYTWENKAKKILNFIGSEPIFF